MAYLALAVVLIVLDHRGGWLRQAREQVSQVVQPLWMVAGWPGLAVRRLQEDAGTLGQLTEENKRLRDQLLLNQARMARLRTVVADNERLRGLLGAAQGSGVDVQLAPVLDIDLDPTRQRLVLRAGARNGVRIGQSVIDAGGLLGQIIDVKPMQSTVLLVTDPSHAVPVAVVRNGVRLVAYGRGVSGTLALENIPTSGDVKVGDVVVTSGLGGRFPAGFVVGTITALRPDESRAFLIGDVRPAAQFDRGREVLLLRSAPPVAVAPAIGEGGAVGGPSGAAPTNVVDAAAPATAAANAMATPGAPGTVAPGAAIGQAAPTQPLNVVYPRPPQPAPANPATQPVPPPSAQPPAPQSPPPAEPRR